MNLTLQTRFILVFAPARGALLTLVYAIVVALTIAAAVAVAFLM
jgi:hypothetical protein